MTGVASRKDWDAIRRDYIESGDKAEVVAARHGVTLDSLYYHSHREQWTATRKEAEKAAKKSHAAAVAERRVKTKSTLDSAVMRMTARVDALIDECQKPSEARQLTLALKDLTDLLGITKRDPLAERELRARIRLLEKQAEPEKREAVEVIIPDEARGWSE